MSLYVLRQSRKNLIITKYARDGCAMWQWYCWHIFNKLCFKKNEKTSSAFIIKIRHFYCPLRAPIKSLKPGKHFEKFHKFHLGQENTSESTYVGSFIRKKVWIQCINQIYFSQRNSAYWKQNSEAKQFCICTVCVKCFELCYTRQIDY